MRSDPSAQSGRPYDLCKETALSEFSGFSILPAPFCQTEVAGLQKKRGRCRFFEMKMKCYSVVGLQAHFQKADSGLKTAFKIFDDTISGA
jgi:hypothetical protein